MSRKPLTLYRFRLSGHSHRVELFLSLLGIPYEIVEVEIGKGEHKTPEFLAKNPSGQVPVLVDGDLVLLESNAILVYLASVYDPERHWYPTTPERASVIQRWLSAAVGPLLMGPGYARLVGVFKAKHDIARTHTIARRLFGVMEEQLRAGGGCFVGARPTIADVALYTYTAHAPEGHISLEPYPAIRAWLHVMESIPGFVPMDRTEPRSGLSEGL